MTDKGTLEAIAATDARVKEEREKAIERIALQLLSIRPEHSDTIHPPYPPSAGVMREALRQAFSAGMSTLALIILEANFARK